MSIPPPSIRDDIVVVTGAGGLGEAVARRLAPGRLVVLADASEDQLDGAVERLSAAGHRVHAVRVDVSSAADVTALAATAAGLGAIRAVVHTAGVSPYRRRPSRSSPSTSSAPRACSTRSSRTSRRARWRCASPAWPAR